MRIKLTTNSRLKAGNEKKSPKHVSEHGVNTARFLKYVWHFSNFIYEIKGLKSSSNVDENRRKEVFHEIFKLLLNFTVTKKL